jgi:hypothetical protein
MKSNNRITQASMLPALLVCTLTFIISSCGNGTTGPVKEQTGWLESPALQAVTVNDSFWKPLIERNRTVTIPYVFGKCEETGRIDNFAVAGGLKKGKHTGERYNDSDVFKIIEGDRKSTRLNSAITLTAW